MKIFEVKDKSGRVIYLSDERWKHIQERHSDVKSIEDIKETVAKPFLTKQDKIDEDLQYSYRYYKEKKRYLMVAVKYLNGAGFVLTSFYTKRIRT